ncbi:MAG: hypothetical protein CMO46_09170 [Verrucomicrobiales bacterium]|jgi:hypothetical protein|nr:hypothetical protein [Verrucomicrobiales bacterium]
MKWSLTIMLIAIVLLLTVRREPFTEVFGFSGYTKPTGTIRLDDARPDLNGYSQAEANIDNDTMEEFILQANKEIAKRTGICTYIIETTSVKKYVNEEDKSIYECMFMVVKNTGFAFGFSVVASYESVNGGVRLVSLRSQPLDVQTVSNVTPFAESRGGQEFVKYDLVKEAAVPTQGELESAKNNLKQM